MGFRGGAHLRGEGGGEGRGGKSERLFTDGRQARMDPGDGVSQPQGIGIPLPPSPAHRTPGHPAAQCPGPPLLCCTPRFTCDEEHVLPGQQLHVHAREAVEEAAGQALAPATLLRRDGKGG